MNLDEWLGIVSKNLKGPSAVLEMRAYSGTEVQVQRPIALWSSTTGIARASLDLAEITLVAAHAKHARDLVEDALKSVAARPATTLVVVNNAQILSVLYPDRATQPLSRFLRTGHFAVLITVGLEQDWNLPAGAILTDWRSLLFQSAPLLQTAAQDPSGRDA